MPLFHRTPPPVPTVLITGATDGIGLALARLWAQQGARLVLIGRLPLSALTDAVFTDASYCQVDLARPDCVATICAFLQAAQIESLDLVVHNAGSGFVGHPAEQAADAIAQMVQVNLTTPIQLTIALLPAVQRARGQFLFVSSVAAALPTPRYAVYGATKAALEGFARSLRVEVGRTVTVQVVRPGATRTGMHRKSGLPTDRPVRGISAEKAARAILSASLHPRRIVTIGRFNRFLTILASLPGQERAWCALRHWLRRRPRPAQSAPHTVITGAADGIGRALARQYAAAGYRVTGVDRDAERGEETRRELAAAGAAVTFVQADLAREQAWVADLPPVDLLIHNAGINAFGRIESADLEEQAAVVAVNLVAPMQITARLLAEGKLGESADLIFLSSLSRFTGYPGAPTYAATKDGLAHYARSLRFLRGHRGDILTVFPGPVRTAHARRYSPDNRREGRRMPPATLARLIGQSHRRRAITLLPGFAARLLALVGTLFPRLAERLMRRALLDKLPHAG